MNKKQLDALIDNQLYTIRHLLSGHVPSEDSGRTKTVEMYQEAGYCYSLLIDKKPVLTCIGEGNFTNALTGFIRGLCFVWGL